MASNQHRVWLITPGGADEMQINGPESLFAADVKGLWDLPQYEPKLSPGYQGGSKLTGSSLQPRQIRILLTLEAGIGQGASKRNPIHNQIRDELLRFLPEGGRVVVRTEYPGSVDFQGLSEYWDIECQVLQGPWGEGTSTYEVALLAPSPTLTNATTRDVTYRLDDGDGTAEIARLIRGGGNTYALPVITIHPTNLSTSGKSGFYRWRRLYSVANNSLIDLVQYPVAIPFNIQWHIDNGRLLSAAHVDLRVKQEGKGYVDFYWGGTNAQLLYAYLDIPANQSVTVYAIYGNADDTGYIPKAPRPAFEIYDVAMASLVPSTNEVWRYNFSFMPTPASPDPTLFPWTSHYANREGFVPITRPYDSAELPLPFGSGGGVNVAGGEMVAPGKVLGYAGVALHHPLGFTEIAHHGFTQIDPTQAKLVLRARNSYGVIEDLWQAPDSDTTSAYTEYTATMESLVFATTVEAVVFALRSGTRHALPEGSWGAADIVELTIYNPPSVIGAGTGASNEYQLYHLQAELENESTGEQINLDGDIYRAEDIYDWKWNRIVLDLENHTITQQGPTADPNVWVDLEDFSYAISFENITTTWLRFLAGANYLRLKDYKAQDLDITIKWRPRRN